MNGLPLFGQPPGGPLGAGVSGGLPPIAPSPATFAGGVSPATNTILASPMAERYAGYILQQQQMAVEGQIVELVRRALRMLAERKRTVDPRQAAQIERMAAQLLQFFPSVSPPTKSDVTNLASEVPRSPINLPLPGPVSTGSPLSLL